MKFLLACILTFTFTAPSFANDQFACEAVYKTKEKRNSKFIERTEDHEAWNAAPVIMIVAGVMESTPLFFLPLAASGALLIVNSIKASQIETSQLLQSAIAEAQVGNTLFKRSEIEALVGFRVSYYESGLEHLVKKLNLKRNIDNELTYDDVAQRLRDLAPTEELCPKGKPLSFRKIKKIISEV